MEGVEFHGEVNLLKAGLMYADAITTVSPTYAKEVRSSKEYGYGLEGVFKKKARKTYGILNGMDDTVWNPEVDKLIAKTYSADTLEDKQVNKKALCEHFKLPYDPKVPVIGIVSRLADQKGFDLIEEKLEDLMKMDLQLVVLGSGEKKYEDLFTKAAKKYKKKIGAHIGFDEGLAHLIEAGADMFLMPSKYEPCGLNQMYSLRYGTLPIVRSTGGLADTVEDLNAKPKSGTGFVFEKYQAKQMLDAVKRAVSAFADEKVWTPAMKRAMSRDNSWGASAEKYIELYKNLLKKK
jgi:starch synthase